MRRAITPALLPMLVLLVLPGCGGGERGGEADPSPSSDAVLPEGAQALSLLGDTLWAPPLPEEVWAEREARLEAALKELEASPEDPDALIWVGRRYAYLGEYRKAIETFTRGMELNPEDARLYRHRGHRYITVRELDRAVADFRRAAELIRGRPDEVEPDGLPNPRGIPTSTLHFNVWYHYGLALYLQGKLEEALEAYRSCWEASRSQDSRVATTHWLYMTLRRLGLTAEAEAVLARIDPETEVIESGSYLDLLRLYRGDVGAAELLESVPPGSLAWATVAYGVGNWYLYNGEEERAREIFRAVVEQRSQWPSFGYVAAEAELARMGEGRS